MEENKNDRSVEKRMKDNLRFDRARVQMGKISGFGLLELSRQRRRTGVLEGTSHVCENCQGAGRVRSVESASLALLRALDETCAKRRGRIVEARAAGDVALYLLNEKRDALAALEENRRVRVRIGSDASLAAGEFEINVSGGLEEEAEAAPEAQAPPRRQALEAREEEEEFEAEEAEAEAETETEAPEAVSADGEAQGERRGRRRRGRRGGRRRREEGEAMDDAGQGLQAGAAQSAAAESPAPAAPASGEERAGKGRRRRGRGRGRGRRTYEVDGGEWLDFVSGDLRQLSPRPERRFEALAAGEEEAESPLAPLAEAAPAPQAPPAALTAEIEAAPVAPAPVAAPAMAHANGEAEMPAALATLEAEALPAYEPDQERREKFFSRLQRWSKKP